MPSVSLRNVLYHPVGRTPNGTSNGLRVEQLYYDKIHPGPSGHTVAAQGVIHLLKRAQLLLEVEEPASCSVGVGAGAGTGAGVGSAPPAAATGGDGDADVDGGGASTGLLPPPMRARATAKEQQVLQCSDADALLRLRLPDHRSSRHHGGQTGASSSSASTPAPASASAVSSCAGWWLQVLASRRGKTAGMHLLTANTSAAPCALRLPVGPPPPVGRPPPVGHGSEGAAAPAAKIQLAYRVATAPTMARLSVACEGGCSCDGLRIDGRVVKPKPGVRVANFTVHASQLRPAPTAACALVLRVLPRGGEGGDGGGDGAQSFSLVGMVVNRQRDAAGAYFGNHFGEWILRKGLSLLAQARSADDLTFG